MQLVLERVGLAHHLEHLDAGSGDHRRDGVGEQVRAGTLAEHRDDLLLAGGESADRAAEALAQRAGEDLDLAAQVELLGGAAARLADHAGRVRLVDHHHGIVLRSEGVDLIERSDVAVHREHAVGDDQAVTLCLCGLQAVLQLFHVGIGVAVALCLAEAHAVDDRSVVQRVGDDGVVLVEQGLEHTAVRVEARSVEDGVFRAEELGDLLLKLFVEIAGTADEADGRHAVAVRIQRLLGGFHQLRVVGQSEIVVGAEVQHVLARLDLDGCLLGGGNDTFFLIEAGVLDRLELGFKILLEISIHGTGFLRYYKYSKICVFQQKLLTLQNLVVFRQEMNLIETNKHIN